MMRAYTILFGILMLLGLSCEKETFRQSESGYPIELTAVANDDGTIELNWTKLSISDFNAYYVIQDMDSIPDLISPNISPFLSTIKFITGDVQITSWVDERPAVGRNLYYRVAAVVGNRVLMSPNIKVDYEMNVLPFGVGQWTTLPSENLFAIRKGAIIYTYDYKNDLFLDSAEIANNYYEEGNFKLCLFPNNQPVLVYKRTYSSKDFEIYNAINYELLGSYEDNSEILDITVGDDFFYIASTHIASSIRILDIHDFLPINHDVISNNTANRKLVAIQEKRELVEIHHHRLAYYKLNDQGNVLDAVETDILDLGLSASDNLKYVALSPDGNYFIPFKTGMIFDTSLNEFGTLQEEGDPFRHILFKKDGTKIYGLKDKRVEIYSFPDLNLEGEVHFSFDARFVLESEEGVEVVGNARFGASIRGVIKPFKL